MLFGNVWKTDVLDQFIADTVVGDVQAMLRNIGVSVSYLVYNSTDSKFEIGVSLSGYFFWSEERQVEKMRAVSKGYLLIATADLVANSITPKQTDIVKYGSREYGITDIAYIARSVSSQVLLADSIYAKFSVVEKLSMTRLQ